MSSRNSSISRLSGAGQEVSYSVSGGNGATGFSSSSFEQSSGGFVSGGSSGGAVEFSSGSARFGAARGGSAASNSITSASAGAVSQIANDLLQMQSSSGSASFGASGASSGSASFGASGQSSGSASFGASGQSSGSASFGASGQSGSASISASGASGSASFGASGSSSGSVSGSASGSASGAVLSAIEQAIIRSNVPIEVSESEEITVNFKGQQETGVWSNKSEIVNWKGVIPITEYLINEDMNPEVITKRSEQTLEYIQELAIRYLRPPTPPAPGEIVIKSETNSHTAPAPPLVLRQLAARPDTPEPLVIREAPPKAPEAVGRKVITISGKRIPPPARKVVIERLAPLPSKPQSVMVERWLPYSEVKRRVIFQRSNESEAVVVKPRNVVVQWEAPRVVIKKEFKYLGVIRANPVEYVQRYGATLKMAGELPDFVLDIKTPEGLTLAADYKYNSVYELEGDVKAMQLVDLDREGLSEYRALLTKLGFSYVGAEQVLAAAARIQVSGSSASISASGASGSASFGASGSASGSASFGASGASSGSASFGASGASSGSASFGASGASSGSAATISGASGSVSASRAVIASIFASIDTDNSGSISSNEAATVLLRLNSRLGRSYGEREANAFFKTLDSNKNGQLSLEEFTRAFESLL